MKFFYAGITLAVFFALALIFMEGCKNPQASHAPQPTCMLAEDSDSVAVGFGRCETNEVVCYVSKGGQTCYVKTPQVAPTSTPHVTKKAK